MNKQFYAVCNVNGPVSVSIEADSIDAAVAVFSELDPQGVVYADECDAEDDLGFCGDGMSEDEFEAAMEGRGYIVVRDLDQIHNYHTGEISNLQNGWRLYAQSRKDKSNV